MLELHRIREGKQMGDCMLSQVPFFNKPYWLFVWKWEIVKIWCNVSYCLTSYTTYEKQSIHMVNYLYFDADILCNNKKEDKIRSETHRKHFKKDKILFVQDRFSRQSSALSLLAKQQWLQFSDVSFRFALVIVYFELLHKGEIERGGGIARYSAESSRKSCFRSIYI